MYLPLKTRIIFSLVYLFLISLFWVKIIRFRLKKSLVSRIWFDFCKGFRYKKARKMMRFLRILLKFLELTVRFLWKGIDWGYKDSLIWENWFLICRNSRLRICFLNLMRKIYSKVDLLTLKLLKKSFKSTI